MWRRIRAASVAIEAQVTVDPDRAADVVSAGPSRPDQQTVLYDQDGPEA